MWGTQNSNGVSTRLRELFQKIHKPEPQASDNAAGAVPAAKLPSGDFDAHTVETASGRSKVFVQRRSEASFFDEAEEYSPIIVSRPRPAAEKTVAPAKRERFAIAEPADLFINALRKPAHRAFDESAPVIKKKKAEPVIGEAEEPAPVPEVKESVPEEPAIEITEVQIEEVPISAALPNADAAATPVTVEAAPEVEPVLEIAEPVLQEAAPAIVSEVMVPATGPVAELEEVPADGEDSVRIEHVAEVPSEEPIATEDILQAADGIADSQISEKYVKIETTESEPVIETTEVPITEEAVQVSDEAAEDEAAAEEVPSIVKTQETNFEIVSEEHVALSPESDVGIQIAEVPIEEVSEAVPAAAEPVAEAADTPKAEVVIEETVSVQPVETAAVDEPSASMPVVNESAAETSVQNVAAGEAAAEPAFAFKFSLEEENLSAEEELSLEKDAVAVAEAATMLDFSYIFSVETEAVERYGLEGVAAFASEPVAEPVVSADIEQSDIKADADVPPAAGSEVSNAEDLLEATEPVQSVCGTEETASLISEEVPEAVSEAAVTEPEPSVLLLSAPAVAEDAAAEPSAEAVPAEYSTEEIEVAEAVPVMPEETAAEPTVEKTAEDTLCELAAVPDVAETEAVGMFQAEEAAPSAEPAVAEVAETSAVLLLAAPAEPAAQEVPIGVAELAEPSVEESAVGTSLVCDEVSGQAAEAVSDAVPMDEPVQVQTAETPAEEESAIVSAEIEESAVDREIAAQNEGNPVVLSLPSPAVSVPALPAKSSVEASAVPVGADTIKVAVPSLPKKIEVPEESVSSETQVVEFANNVPAAETTVTSAAAVQAPVTNIPSIAVNEIPAVYAVENPDRDVLLAFVPGLEDELNEFANTSMDTNRAYPEDMLDRTECSFKLRIHRVYPAFDGFLRQLTNQH